MTNSLPSSAKIIRLWMSGLLGAPRNRWICLLTTKSLSGPACSKLLPLGLSWLAHLVSNCAELCLVLSPFFDASPSLMGWEALVWPHSSDALPGCCLRLWSLLGTLSWYLICVWMSRRLRDLSGIPWYLCIKFTIPRSTEQCMCLISHVKMTQKTSLNCLYTDHIYPNLTQYKIGDEKKETETEENLSSKFSNLL